MQKKMFFLKKKKVESDKPIGMRIWEKECR